MGNVFFGCSIEKRSNNQSDTDVCKYEIPAQNKSVNNLLQTWLREPKTQNIVFCQSINSIFILNRNVCVKEQINN